MSAHSYSFAALTGGIIKLSDFAGRAVLVVNVASHCGLTPQYQGLQALWRQGQSRGLVVLGVPSNDFGAQEPGSDEEIARFCTTRYGVDFPMTAKVSVIGSTAHPFYQWILEEVGEAAAPRWNFHKYLIDKNGALAEVFGSRVAPDAPELSSAIERVLAEP